MKVVTNSTVEPQITIDTVECNDVSMGEADAHETWIDHCNGSTLDESVTVLAQWVMEKFVMESREAATAYTYGLIRSLLSKSRKPAGTPANLEGASQ